MKHFVYLDQRHLFSFYSQAFDGLEQTRITDASDINQTEKVRQPSKIKSSYKLGFGIQGIAELAGEFSKEDKNLITHYLESESAREVVTQALHDNALTHAIEYAQKNKLLCEDRDFAVGKYVLLKGSYQSVDWDYFSGLLSEDFANQMAKDAGKKAANALSLPGAPKHSGNDSQRIIKEAEKKARDNINEPREMIKLIKSMMPYESMIVVEGIILPTKQNNYIESPSEINYSYSGPITAFGRVTKINTALTANQGGKSMQELFSGVNDMLYQLLKTMGISIKTDATIVVPIAVFFE